MSPMPLPGGFEEETKSVRDDVAEPLRALQEDRAEDRADDRAEPTDDDHRQHPDALDRREDVRTERLLVEHEHTAGERREEAGQGERHQLDPGRSQAECLRVPLVVTLRDEITECAGPLQPTNRDQHEEQREDGEEVEVPLRVRTAAADSDAAERRPLRRSAGSGRRGSPADSRT